MRCEQILYATKRVPHQLHTHPSHPSHPFHPSHPSHHSLPPPSILIVVNTNPCCFYCSSLKHKIKDIFITSPIHALLPLFILFSISLPHRPSRQRRRCPLYRHRPHLNCCPRRPLSNTRTNIRIPTSHSSPNKRTSSPNNLVAIDISSH